MMLIRGKINTQMSGPFFKVRSQTHGFTVSNVSIARAIELAIRPSLAIRPEPDSSSAKNTRSENDQQRPVTSGTAG